MNKFYTSSYIADEENNELKYTSGNEEEKNNENILYKRYKNKSAITSSRILILAMGFCVGMALFCCFTKKISDVNLFQIILNGKELENIKNYEINKKIFLAYIFEIRLKQLFFIVICSVSFFSAIFTYVWIGLFGIVFGILCFSSIYEYGLIGLLLSIALMFPHYFFYYCIFAKIFKIYPKFDVNNCSKFAGVIYKIKEIFVVCVLFFCGIISETYINSELVKKILILL